MIEMFVLEACFFKTSGRGSQFALSLRAMRMITSLLLVSVFSSCMLEEGSSSCLDGGKLYWLTGSWKMEDQDIYETWSVDSDTRLLGRSFAIADGDTSLLEHMSLEIKGGEGVFVARVTGQNGDQPVAFVLTRCDEGRLVFENPEHDFPQRIVYERGEHGTLLAWVEGGDRKLTFTYQRAES